MRKFPASPYAGRAQAQLERLPPVDSATARSEQAISELRARYRDEAGSGKKQAPITDDDLRGISKVPSDMKTAKVLIPPASDAQGPAAPQAPADRLTLVYAYPEDDRVTLKVAYQLGSSHSKPVHAAARLTYPAGNSVFAYGADTLAQGSGETSIVMRLSVPIAVSRPASIRLMLFESQGPMFFSVTVPYP